MQNNRDDFTEKTKDRMAKRVGYRCSNPNCRKLTCGAAEEPNDYVNIGVAAHICAAAPKGKRYDQNMTASQRKSILNGIWLCQTCSKLIDSDEKRYTVELLQQWKYDAERETAGQLEYNARDTAVPQKEMDTLKLNQQIEELLSSMERIYQKLDAAKQDDNMLMTQAYEERLAGLMLMFTDMNNRLKRSFSDDEKDVSHWPETVADLKTGAKRKKQGERILAVSLATVAGVIGIVNTGVLQTLAFLVCSVMLGWFLGALFCDGNDNAEINCQNSGTEFGSTVDIKAYNVRVMMAAINYLESEVGKLHMDRIEYERSVVEANRIAEKA